MNVETAAEPGPQVRENDETVSCRLDQPAAVVYERALLLLELVLGRPADRAGPVIRKILERGSRVDSVVRISILRVINISTH